MSQPAEVSPERQIQPSLEALETKQEPQRQNENRTGRDARQELVHALSSKRDDNGTTAQLASSGIMVGDTVRVRYLSGDETTLIVTISDEKSDPANGVIHVDQPLAQALLGSEVDEEVEVLVGPRVRLAKVEEIKRAQTA